MLSRCDSSDCNKEHDNLKWDIFRKMGLDIFHLNINSLLPEVDESRFIIKQSNISIIGISKSKLSLSILNSEADSESYSVIRMNRSTRRRGLACYIKKPLSYNHKLVLYPNIKSIFINILFPNQRQFW